MSMWGFGWGIYADRGAAGAARRCLTGVGLLSYRLGETERKSSWALANNLSRTQGQSDALTIDRYWA